VRHLPGRKNIISVLALLLVALVAWNSRRDANHSRPDSPARTDQPPASSFPGNAANPASEAASSRQVDFDFYLLAMTLHPAFCADGHARKRECQVTKTVPLSIHGLWPERTQPGAYPRDCQGPRLQLDDHLLAQLQPLMPGIGAGLHVHEWNKHGRCSNLLADEYFQYTLVLARRLDAALRDELTTSAGQVLSTRELRAAADRHEAGLGESLTFHCRTLRDAPPQHRQQPFLIEIRQCFDNDGEAGAPGTLLRCADMNRRDQGCGKTFRIAP
jgi:ribonuclease I